MLILGIETSCDDTGIALVEINSGVPINLLNLISSQVKIHAKYGGVVPYLAARYHEKNLYVLIEEAIKKHRHLKEALGLIAVTVGPGLGPSLLMGIVAAKLLSYSWQKPIIAVNHLEGHLFSPFLNDVFERPIFNLPFLCLLVSGGHTELVVVKGVGEYLVLGRTLDDACGEAFDKVARLLGLGYPGGPQIERLALEFKPNIKNQRPKLLFKPPMINSNNFNFSYSGLKTAVLYKIKSQKTNIENSYIAWHFQEAALMPLVKKTLAAVQKYDIKTIFVAGGVSANNRLKELFKEELEAKNLKIKIYFPDKILTQDNAAMIAYVGYLKYLKKKKNANNLEAIFAQPNLAL